jgi:hypothetical protein
MDGCRSLAHRATKQSCGPFDIGYPQGVHVVLTRPIWKFAANGRACIGPRIGPIQTMNLMLRGMRDGAAESTFASKVTGAY